MKVQPTGARLVAQTGARRLALRADQLERGGKDALRSPAGEGRTSDGNAREGVDFGPHIPLLLWWRLLHKPPAGSL